MWTQGEDIMRKLKQALAAAFGAVLVTLLASASAAASPSPDPPPLWNITVVNTPTANQRIFYR